MRLHVRMVLHLLVLVALANGTPVAVNRLLGSRWNWPLDGGLKLPDGQPLFGVSKTLRGIVTAVVVTLIGASALNLGWQIGAAVGATAMAGDLLSSFCKRRMRLTPGSRATGLDQIPESLLPALVARQTLSLSVMDVVATTLIFMIAEMALSVLFFRWHLRERPY
ncbi:MAG TPA: CDP-archaeol synthase [Edaphobacter sp.]|nr:CDP-archaeol synthase [Edaphobacter sp.]